MRVAILRREPEVTFSMDVYADELIAGLRTVRPNWDIFEATPKPWWTGERISWQSGTGIRKYYERFWQHPRRSIQIEADIFHIIDHTDGHLGYWLKKANRPFVLTCHDLVQFVYPEILRDQSRIPSLSLAVWKYSVTGMHQANHVFAVSQNTKNDIEKYLNIHPKNISVSQNAVSSDFRVLSAIARLSARKRYRSPEDICLLNVGSTHYRKNIITVLAVLRALKQNNLSVCLLKIGGDFTPQQKEYIQTNNLAGNIAYLEMPSRSELIDIYNSADILLAPSLYEGFGLTVLEAMACGLPVITSNTSSLPEVGGDAVEAVNPTDVDQIVEKIKRLTTDDNHRKLLIEKGLQRAAMFSWEKTAEQIAQVYESILNKKSA